MLRPYSANSITPSRCRPSYALFYPRPLCLYVSLSIFSLCEDPMNGSTSRRDILRTLAVTAAGSILQVIPAEAAEYVHQMVHKEKAATPAGAYTPKYFSAAQYATLLFLCDSIIPKDEKSGGAVEAGAPEFIDLLTSENPE